MNKNLENFLTFLKIGVTTFGGGYAMISNVKEEIVDKKGWITNEELLDLLAVAESTPGPIAINMATYIGFKRSKFLGALISTLGVVLPSFLIILGITYLFNAFIDNKYVAFAFTGIKAAVAFLILKSGLKLLKETKFCWWQYLLMTLVLTAAILIDIFSWNFSTIFVLLISGFIGLLIGFFVKKPDILEESK